MDLSTFAAIASVVLTIMVPAVGWLLARVVNYGERLVKIETEQEALKVGVAKDVKDLRDDVKTLSEELKRHMENEAEQLKQVMREVMAEQRG